MVLLGRASVLINRRHDGRLEIRDDLVFHGGIGSTLEIRQFGLAATEELVLQTGFREVDFLEDDIPPIGIIFDGDVSQPLIARKAPFGFDLCARPAWRMIPNSPEPQDFAYAFLVRILPSLRWLWERP